MNNLWHKSYLLFIVSLMVSQITIAAETNNWNFMIEGYALASSIDGDAGVGRVVNAEVDVGFDDILDNLELAAMVHAEAFHENNWGVIFDYGFMNLASDKALRFGGAVDVDARQGVMELFVARKFLLQKGHIDIYAGVRWWENEVNIDINPAILPGSVEINVEKDWVDPVIGIRWLHPLSEKWTLTMRGDVGGFGIASDSTWLVSAGAQYKFNQSWKLDLKYKALWVDYEDGTPGERGYFAYDTVTHGPIVGAIYSF